ncbi:MAG: O-unit flippase-like protein [Roseburia sp.]
MKINLTKKDIIWGYIGTILNMGSNLLMLPFLMYFLDGDMLGLWYVFASIGAIAVLFDFGFGVTFARNITYCWAGAKELKRENVVFTNDNEPNFQLMKQVLSTCKIIYGLIASAALVLLLSVGTVYVGYVSRELSGYMHYVAWIIYSIAVFLNLFYGYYASFLRGVGDVAQANKNTVFARLAQIIIMVILLAMGGGIVSACAAYLAYGTIFRLLGKHYFYQYKDIGKKLNSVKEKASKKQIKEMFFIIWHNAWRDGAISLCNYFCNQASTIICSMYLSLAETGVYSIGVQIASAIATIAGTLYNTYQPELQSAYVINDKKKMQRTMSMIVISFIYLFVLGTIAVLTVGMPILRIIKPSAVVSVPVLLGLCVYQFILKFRNCYTSYFSCTNRIIYVNGFLASAILCVILSFISIGSLAMGIGGLIFAQIISQAVYNLWRWPTLAHKELELSVGEMIKVGTEEELKMIRTFFPGKRTK